MTEKINAIEKALKIVLLFAPYNQEMGTVEIGQKLRFHKATVSRILNSLIKYGFLQQNPQTKKCRLGQSVAALGLAVQDSIESNQIVHIAKPYLDTLRDTLGETTVLEVLSDGHIIMAYIAEGRGPIRIRGLIGEVRPANASAGAKAILAFSLPDVRKKLLAENVAPLTPNTLTDPLELEAHLAEIRRKGFAIDNEEVHLGINAVAAPVFNLEKKPVAAVVAAGLSHAIQWESESPIVRGIKETAAKISAQLYYSDGAGKGPSESR